MRPVEVVKDRLYMVSVDDLNKGKFESIWEIPEGISYNSYVLFGPEKTVVFDAVDARFSIDYLELLRELISPNEIDYIILQHLEPDHTGALPALLSEAKRAKVVSSLRGLDIAKAYYGVEGGIVASGPMDLGGGEALEFLDVPWVHWPETFFSIWRDVLFTCDGFGAYGALLGRAFSNQYGHSELLWLMKKYYANVISAYSPSVRRALKRIGGLKFRTIAPSHGPIHVGEGWIEEVMEAYASWSYFRPRPKLTIVYGTMYGFVGRLAEAVAKGALKVDGIEVILLDISRHHMSDIMGELLDSSAFALGMPTYEGEIFPPIKFLIDVILHKRFEPRPVGLFGLYSWGGRATEKSKAMLEAKRFEVVEPVVNCRVGEGVEEAERLGEELGRRARTS